MQDYEGIKEYMLPYTWTVGLGKITGIGRGTWKNSGGMGGL